LPGAMKFRKKPVVIDAVPIAELLRDAASDWKGLPSWVRDEYDRGNVIFGNAHVLINTLEGTHRGEKDDMLIRGVKGELYPCKPDIFALIYESANEEPTVATPHAGGKEA
jgi:hypothetical protein